MLSEEWSSEMSIGRATVVRNRVVIMVGKKRRYYLVVEILKGLQQTAILVSGRGEKYLSSMT